MSAPPAVGLSAQSPLAALQSADGTRDAVASRAVQEARHPDFELAERRGKLVSEEA